MWVSKDRIFRRIPQAGLHGGSKDNNGREREEDTGENARKDEPPNQVIESSSYEIMGVSGSAFRRN